MPLFFSTQKRLEIPKDLKPTCVEEYTYSPLPAKPHPELVERLDEFQREINVLTYHLEGSTKTFVFNRALIALDQELKYGVDAGYKIAQAIMESDRGQSKLSRVSNNEFCRKRSRNWKGPVEKFKDDDYVNGRLVKSSFIKFANVEDSWQNHSVHLKDMYPRAAKANSVRAYFNGLQSGRFKYASSKSYVQDGIWIYREYNLDKISDLVLNNLHNV